MKLGLDADGVLTTTRSVRKRLDLEKPVEREVIDRQVGGSSGVCLALQLEFLLELRAIRVRFPALGGVLPCI